MPSSVAPGSPDGAIWTLHACGRLPNCRFQCPTGTRLPARSLPVIGIVALAVGVIGLAALVAAGVPGPVRLVLLLPFWGGAFSWLQARRRFCGAFAMRRLSNFGESEATRRQVLDDAAHRIDLAALARMTRDSFVIGALLTLVALLLPP